MRKRHNGHFYNDLMRCFDASLCRRGLKVVAAVVFGGVLVFQAQTQEPPVTVQHAPPGSTAEAPSSSDSVTDPMARRAMIEQAKRRNEQRQQDIVKDTDKLLDLAQELKAEVDKSNKDEMSISVIKKAEEIEKLAKSVKEKMKGY